MAKGSLRYGDVGTFDSGGAGTIATFMVISEDQVLVLADTDADQLFVGQIYGTSSEGRIMGSDPEWLDRA